jgi:hypothetical protein
MILACSSTFLKLGECSRLRFAFVRSLSTQTALFILPLFNLPGESQLNVRLQ